jgi:hypothetical protein
MNDDDRRRATDPLIVEMHGMLTALVQKMDDHIREDEKAHAKLDDLDRRFDPVESFHGSMKTAGKVAAVVGTPALLGVGAGLWAWLKGIISHAKVTP